MPLLEITTSRKVTATVSLEEPTANLVNQYAAFTRVAADDVVNKALEYVFAKDADGKPQAVLVDQVRIRRVRAEQGIREHAGKGVTADTGNNEDGATAEPQHATPFAHLRTRPRTQHAGAGHNLFGTRHR